MRMEADMRMKSMAAAAPQFQEESFFEYHLYTLDRPATIKDNQTKQLSLFSASAIPVRKRLLVASEPNWFRNNTLGTGSQNQKVKVVLEIKNDQASGLGLPLPKGVVRVYKKDKSGAEQFVGEDQIDHTPKDEMVRLQVGDAFDVVAERSQTDYKA